MDPDLTIAMEAINGSISSFTPSSSLLSSSASSALLTSIDSTKAFDLQSACSLIFVKGLSIYKSFEEGISPLLECYTNKMPLKDYTAGDKIVGKAAAFLYSLLGIKALYALVITTDAKRILEERGVKVYYSTLTSSIINRAGDGDCPMEMAVKGVKDSFTAVERIKEKVEELNKANIKDSIDKKESKIVLGSLSIDAIKEVLKIKERYKALDIYKAIRRGERGLESVTTLKLTERKEFSKLATFFDCRIRKVFYSEDKTIKIQVETIDNLAIEAVLLQDENKRVTACLSSQAGCNMACAYCKTGTLGCARSLTSSEILGQLYFLIRSYRAMNKEGEAKKAVDNIVFMGMGEPLLNLENVLKAIEVLTSKEVQTLSVRNITISTCGIVEGIKKLAALTKPPRLAVSLTSAKKETRDQLMKVSRQYPLTKLKEAIKEYNEKVKKRVTLEVVLLDKVNTEEEEIKAIAEFTKGINVNINLIKWNKVSGLPFNSPRKEAVDNAYKRLKSLGLNVSIRRERGDNIAGACGQLGQV